MTRPTILVAIALCLSSACQTDQGSASSAQENLSLSASSTARTNSIPAAPILAQEKPAPAPSTAAPGSREARFEALQKDHADAVQAYRALFKDAKTDEDRKKVSETAKWPDEEPFMVRARAILDEDPRDELALDVIVWMFQNGVGQAERQTLLGLIEKHHMKSEKLAGQCRSLATDGTAQGQRIVEKLLADSPHASVRGNACYALAQADLRDIDAAQRLKDETNPEDLERQKKSLGAERAARLETLDVAATKKHAEALFERVVSEYADVAVGKRTLGEQARGDLFEMRHLSVGQVAPEIEAEDLAGTPFKLSDYRGKIVMLDFWGHW